MLDEKEIDADVEIIERIKNGDMQAYDILVLKYQTRISKFLYKLLNSPNDVPDAVQETFIKAYKGLASFRNESKFYTWLYRIASNVAYNMRDSQKRRPPSEDIDIDDDFLDISGNLRDNSNNPEDFLISEEKQKMMESKINSLPAKLKDPLMLKEYYEYSYEEIANVLGVNVDIVRSRIFRARLKLKELLE